MLCGPILRANPKCGPLWKVSLTPKEARIIGVMRLAKKKEIGNRLYYWSRLVEKLDQLIARLTANARRGSNGSDQFCALKMSLMPGQLWFSRLSAVLSTLSYVGREASKCVKK